MRGTPTALLEVEELSVEIAGRQVVRGASFHLLPHERVALVGPSGGGKTTLLRATLGLIDVTAGRVRFDGRPLAPDALPAFRREVIWVSQRPVMTAGTVEENLALAFTYGVNAARAFDRARAERLLDELALGASRMSARARRLSEGQQKRVALVRALLLSPRALLLDEPTAGLDGASSAALEGLLIREGRDSGLACAIVTHDLALAERLCHRVVDLTPHLLGDRS